MAEVKFVKAEGAASTLEVDTTVFGKAVRLRVTRQAVISYEANKRQGTRSTKTRGQVSGSRKKLWRQKGTGRARVGDRKVVHRRGGGIVFGPTPRTFGGTIPRNIRRSALRSAILSKFRDNQASVFEVPGLERPKTKAVVQLMKSLGIEGSVLFVTQGVNQVFYRSARNLGRVSVLPESELNALDLLRHDHFVIEESALETLRSRLSNASAE